MSQYLPYILVIGMIFVFFAVCYLVYSGDDSEPHHTGEHKTVKNAAHRTKAAEKYETPRASAAAPQRPEETGYRESAAVQVHKKGTVKGATGYLTKNGEIVNEGGEILYKSEREKQVADDADSTRVLRRDEMQAAMNKARAVAENARGNSPEKEPSDTSLAGLGAVVAADLAARETTVPTAKELTLGATQPVPLAPDILKHEPADNRTTDTKEAPPPQKGGKEARFETARPAASTVNTAEHGSPEPWNDTDLIDSPLLRRCTEHFLGQYTFTGIHLEQQVRYITGAAFTAAGAATDEERERVLMSFEVQDALRQVQKAYTAHPESFVETLALRAFKDVVHCSRTSTRHLVATDALKVMPVLTRPHYQILALLLLFLYSRNSHNVDKETFIQYIDKYVLPIVDRFPTERPYYQQLDYLHCTAVETKGTSFAALLGESYPLLFRYRGFTEEELRKALTTEYMPAEFVVQSFNSPLYKLALIDESMAPRFFRLAGIEDRHTQERLLRLARKRPADFSGEEALDVMESISPILADMSDIWDSTMLRVSTLSFLGLYLGQGYICEAIGEEFDLSRWFE